MIDNPISYYTLRQEYPICLHCSTKPDILFFPCSSSIHKFKLHGKHILAPIPALGLRPARVAHGLSLEVLGDVKTEPHPQVERVEVHKGRVELKRVHTV
ncbi:hypothetical protein BC936DRAFT_148446 [Jimgerdemannia flammicorona]|uniref:Uncharacterized protein n=1 Tax=Jimgerdemannia flammicorona TaxID=994334 RepID=A0A433D331_9FUNG|nr:hypothetical protein BC936DRAFT_148446 [Jimgerdemannia flammicorona]